MTLKLHQLDALIAVADRGSIRGAARALKLTQPALSARIAELEAVVGATLVNRAAQGATLTPAGRAMLAHARVIDNHVRRAERDMAQLTQGGATSIAIGASPLAEVEIVAPLLPALQQWEPEVTLKVIEGQFQEMSIALREGVLELVIAQFPPEKQGLRMFEFEELVTYPMHVVARTAHPLAKARKLADLRDAKWLVGAATSSSRSTLEELYIEYGFGEPKVAVHANAITMVQAALAASDLLGLLVRPLFHGWPQLVPLPIEDRIRPLRLGLITLAGVQLSPAASRFADMVRARGLRVAKDLGSRRRA
jgi:LysR family transcriptional regulator of abg operon